MKSIKPGRGPSGMSFIGAVISIVFGVFWTIIAISITSSFPFGMIGFIFPLFGVIFIIFGIINAMYHYKNTTSKNRYSMYDVTDSSEEGDPADKWIKKESQPQSNVEDEYINSDFNYCPYCGEQLEDDFVFCPKCGRGL